MSAQQKEEVIRLVERSQLSVNQTLRKLGVPTRTYHRWMQNGTLEDERPVARRIWNRLLPQEEETVIARALAYPDRSARQLSFLITDEGRFSVSESTIYRILKREGLQRELPQVMKASKEYHRKTTHVHELWQTDFTYFHIVNWGWYFAGGVLDDYSRYSICFELMDKMDGPATQNLIDKALNTTGMKKVPVNRRAKLLSDNGSGYIAKPFNRFLDESGIHHIYSARNHPQTNGKIERLNRTAKERLNLGCLLVAGGAARGTGSVPQLVQHRTLPQIHRQSASCRCLLRPRRDHSQTPKTAPNTNKKDPSPGQYINITKTTEAPQLTNPNYTLIQ
ncbi:MAG: transposase [bacterium]|nr:transposase [bacterium]